MPPPIAGVDERWLDLAGHRQRYLTCGAGPPLVLVHGLLGYSFSWRFNYAVLGGAATLYAPDSLGTGFSARVPELDCSLRASATRLLAFMDALGLRNADLLGTSHGGAVAVFAAALDREQGGRRIRRLILVDAVNPWSARGRWLVPLLAGSIGRALPWAVRNFAWTQGYWLRRQYADHSRIAPGTLDGYTRPLAIGGTMEHAHRILRCWGADLRAYPQELEKLRELETLLLWGREDSAVYVDSAYEVERRLPRARLVVLPGVGHLPYEESPEEFNRVVMAFLQQDAQPAQERTQHG
ncbi:MAG: alpha/beta hydrolase [Candidatus Koribacter versatilis]|uniref:Alpha/beta hydrolase n=1 Tax=Candidatus Korobacter versatilis TaxID=658062 RepID=A0A932AAF2_9BACT|nr:alpha/beta hydrolase [Candidatus Koribacter versatilis]